MEFSDIVTEVDNIVQDDSFSDTRIKGYVNRALNYVCALVDLPQLKRIGTVATSTSVPYASLAGMTGGFAGRIKRVSDVDVTIYPNLEMLMDNYVKSDNLDLTLAGSLEAVALEGNILWYQYVPATSVDITFLYYQNPTELTEDTDESTDIPEHLHRKLLVHGAAFMVFDQIEDGMEGEKVNAINHFTHSFSEDSKHSGLTKFREWLGKNRNNYISSTWRY